jgi:hypothetical protein
MRSRATKIPIPGKPGTGYPRQPLISCPPPPPHTHGILRDRNGVITTHRIARILTGKFLRRTPPDKKRPTPTKARRASLDSACPRVSRGMTQGRGNRHGAFLAARRRRPSRPRLRPAASTTASAPLAMPRDCSRPFLKRIRENSDTQKQGIDPPPISDLLLGKNRHARRQASPATRFACSRLAIVSGRIFEGTRTQTRNAPRFAPPSASASHPPLSGDITPAYGSAPLRRIPGLCPALPPTSASAGFLASSRNPTGLFQ